MARSRRRLNKRRRGKQFRKKTKRQVGGRPFTHAGPTSEQSVEIAIRNFLVGDRTEMPRYTPHEKVSMPTNYQSNKGTLTHAPTEDVESKSNEAQGTKERGNEAQGTKERGNERPKLNPDQNIASEYIAEKAKVSTNTNGSNDASKEIMVRIVVLKDGTIIPEDQMNVSQYVKVAGA